MYMYIKWSIYVPADNSTAIFGGDEEETQWTGIVAIVGIIIFVIIVVALVGFVYYVRRSRLQQRKKMAAQVNQSLLTANGEVANSPTHSVSSMRQGSTNVSYTDPAGSPTRRNYVVTGKGSQSDMSSAHLPQKLKATSGGRTVKHQVESPHSRHSSQSSRGQRTPGSIPSPYAANAGTGDWRHDADLLQAVPDGSKSSHSQRHGRRKHTSPPASPHKHSGSSQGAVSPTRSAGSHRSTSPGGSVGRSRSNGRGSRTAVPLAASEDLSPLEPMQPINENIQLDSYKSRKKRSQGALVNETAFDANIPDKRPPVEGRDSLTRKPRDHGFTTTAQVHPGTVAHGSRSGVPTTPDQHNGKYLPTDPSRPHKLNLPQRNVQRPDGQSPEHKIRDPSGVTPGSLQSTELSPIFHKSKLFPEEGSCSPSQGTMDIGAPEFEYDDYDLKLPGAYFTMDPHAYTLTWSQAPPWDPKAASRGASQASLRTGDPQPGYNYTSQC